MCYYKYMKKYGILLIVIFGLSISGFYLSGFDKDLLTKISFYLDLANPNIKVVRLPEGLRKEQVAEIVGEKLLWGENVL